MAPEWGDNKLRSWRPRTATNILHRLEIDVFPLIGRHPINEIKAPVVLNVLRQIEKRGALESVAEGLLAVTLGRFARSL